MTTVDRYSCFSYHFRFLCKTQSLIHTVLSNSESSSRPPKQIFFSLVGPLKEGALYKQAPLVVLQERTNGQAEWGWRRDIPGSSRRELQHLGTHSRRGSHLLSEEAKGINLTESYGAGGVHPRTAADSAGTVLGDQVS